MEVSTVAKPQSAQTPSINYEREVLITKIADWLCDDNKVVREMLRTRMENHTLPELREYAEENSIQII
jgi:uncharacterized protein YlaN (UPF0358 family)